MKITKKHLTNIAFVIIIGLMIYPPTKVYFIRLVSFSTSKVNTDRQKQLSTSNWNLKGLNVENVDLNQLQNKVIFVSFWATWCAPCVAEMPSMFKLYKDYKDKVAFLFITNENWSIVSEFYQKKGYNFPTYQSKNDVPKELKSTTIPATFIIDKHKKIAVEKRGPANWNSSTTRDILDALLK